MIRPATEKDIPAILDIYAPYILNTTVSFEYDVPCRREFTQRFLTITAKFPWLVWEEEGEILGYAYASPPFTRTAYAWCAEPSIYLRPQAQGTGIAQALYGALEAIVYRQGYQNFYALICGENKQSLRFHEKMGYHFLAEFPRCGYKMGRWLDLLWLEKPLKIVETPSSFPIPWLSIMQNDKFFLNNLDNFSLF